MTRPDSPERVPRAAIVADAIAAVFILVGLYVTLTGATPRFFLGGWRISVSSPGRAFLIGAVILAIRHWRVPRHPLLARLRSRFNWTDFEERALFPRAAWPSRLLELAAVTLGFAALIAAVTWPQIARMGAVPDLGDPLFSIWRMAWIAHQLPIDPVHLFAGNMFHPEPLALTLSDPLLVAGLVATPLVRMGLQPLDVYTGVLLGSFVCSGVTMYYLVRALTGRRAAAAVAGVVFAVYPYRFEHYSHLELQMTMWMPLVLLGIHRVLARGRWRDAIGTGVAYALQALSSLYYGVMFALYLVPFAVIIWWARRRPAAPVVRLAVGGLLAAAVLAPVALQYVRNKPNMGERPSWEVELYSASPVDYLHAHNRSRVYPALAKNSKAERQLFPGVVPLAIAAVGLVPPLGVARTAYAVAALVAFDGSLGQKGTIFPWLRQYLSPFRELRAPARFSIFVGLTLAILAGYGAARMLAKWPRYTVPITAALIVLAVVDAWPRLELQEVEREPPPIYAALPGSKDIVVAEFPIFGKDPTGIIYDTRYIYYSTFHWHQIVNGNSGFFPASYLKLYAYETSFPDNFAVNYLRERHVDYVIVHGAFYPASEYGMLLAEIAKQPALELVASMPWKSRESRLYRVH